MEAQSRISVLIQTIANLSAEKLGTSMAHNTYTNSCNNACVNNTINSGPVNTCTRCMCERTIYILLRWRGTPLL